MSIRIDLKQICNIIYFTGILVIGVLGEGLISEVLLWMFTLALYATNNTSKKIKGEKKRIALRFVIICSLYVVLFGVHLMTGTFGTIERLYGLTKCICFPYVIYVCLIRKDKKQFMFEYCAFAVTVIDLIYIIRALFHINVFEGFTIGSVNILGALNILVIPWMIYTNRYRFSLLVSVLSFVLFDSGTFVAMGITEVFFSIYIMYFRDKGVQKWFGKLLRVLLIMLVIAFSGWFLYYDKINLNINGSRLHLWRYAGIRFNEASLFAKLFGAGDNVIHLSQAYQQTHNVIIDILMIYGVAGVLLYIGFLVPIMHKLRMLLKNQVTKESLILILTVACSLIYAFYHPTLSACFSVSILSGISFSYYFDSISRNTDGLQVTNIINGNV